MTNKANTTIAFTLPISCQICLGKVKSPVVCSNLHVFCGTCLDVWLERNSICPTCRVPVSKPCRPVLGGLNPQVEKVENFSDSELRRSRMELMYKEYEHEIARLEAELTASRYENQSLRSKVGQGQGETKPAVSPQDRSMITVLNNKLKEASDLYDHVRKDMDKMRTENAGLRNVIQDVNREKQSLKLELGNRSPRKFGRYTVAALESRLESSQKQVAQLERALEKSDSYLADLESDLHSYKLHMCSECKAKVHSLPTKSKPNDSMNLDSSTFDVNDSSKLDSELPSKISMFSDDDSDFRFSDSEKKKRLKEESFELETPKTLDKSSFVLDQPSSMTDGSEMAVDEGGSRARGGGEGHAMELNGRPRQNPDNYKKKLRFLLSEEEEMESLKHNRPSGTPPVSHLVNAPPSTRQVSTLPEPPSMPEASGKQELWSGEKAGNAVGGTGIFSGKAPGIFCAENSVLNMSTTPEIDDCLRLMDEAEKKVEALNQQIGNKQTAVPYHRSTGCTLSSQSATMAPPTSYTPASYSSCLPPAPPLATPTIFPSVASLPSLFTPSDPSPSAVTGHPGPSLSAVRGHRGPTA